MTVFDVIINNKDFQNRFWKRINQKTTDECWEWLGYIPKNKHDRYGRIKIPVLRKQERAHRISFMLWNKINIPHGKIILHGCDNPPCCNPYHLSLGTHLENMKEMLERGRHSTPEQNGSLNPNSKLTEEDVLKIKGMITGGLGNMEISTLFPVSHSAISSIRRGLTWNHL